MKAHNRGVAQTPANSIGIPGVSPIGRLDRRGLPPPSHEADDYTIGLLGSEGNSFTPVKLSRPQLDLILKLEDRINSAAKLSGFHPTFVVYHGGIRNAGTKEQPVWEPAGKPVRPQRI